jgi:methionyl-tRNA formyltransferase
VSAGRPGAPRVRTVFLGSGGFGVPVLEALASYPGTELVGIVTAPPRPAGRGARPVGTPIAEVAVSRGLRPVLTPARLRSPEAIADVLALDPELAVLADYGQLVPPQILRLPHGALNLHPSALPRWRGASPIPATILAGDREAAVSLMQMDAGVDTGPIIAVEPVALGGDETTPALEARLADVAAQLLVRALGPWIRGELEARAQAAVGVTLSRPLRRSDGRLDPGAPAVALERQVRAYQPWPGSFLETDDGRIVVWAASVGPGLAGDRPGTLVGSGDGLALATASDRLLLDEVQPAGGRRMAGAAFRRGRPGLVGRRVIGGRAESPCSGMSESGR